MTAEEYDRGQDRIEDAMETLREYFDTVLILASTYDGGTEATVLWNSSAGCNYSIFGQVKQFQMEAEQEMMSGYDTVFIQTPSDEDEGEELST